MDENTDFPGFARSLASTFFHDPPVGYLRGKTQMRDALVATKGLSELEAEEVLDTLEMQGFLHFEGDPAKPSEVDTEWVISDHPLLH